MPLIPRNRGQRELWLVVLMFLPLVVAGFVWSLLTEGGYDTSDRPTPVPPDFSTPAPEGTPAADDTGLIPIGDGLAIRLPEFV